MNYCGACRVGALYIFLINHLLSRSNWAVQGVRRPLKCYVCRSDKEKYCATIDETKSQSHIVECTSAVANNSYDDFVRDHPKFHLYGIGRQAQNTGNQTFRCASWSTKDGSFAARMCIIDDGTLTTGCNTCTIKTTSDAKCCYCKKKLCNTQPAMTVPKLPLIVSSLIILMLLFY